MEADDEGTRDLRVDVREHGGGRFGDRRWGRQERVEAHARPVTEVRPAQAAEADLLVVGGPTHAHGMSRPSTRKTAAADKENVFPQPTVTPGLRDWIAELPGGNGRSPRRG